MASLKELMSQNRQALDWAINTPPNEKRAEVLNVMGLSDEDATAYKWSLQNQDDPRATEVKNIVISKIANKMPVVQEQGVSTKERFTVKNLLDTAGTDIQAKYLQDQGYQTRVKNDQLQIRKPDQPIWSVVDPNELDLQDVLDHVGDAIEIGTGIAATVPAGFLGGAAVSGGIEAGKQAIGRVLGVREELAPSQVGLQAALGGIGAKAGQIIGQGVQKGYSKLLDLYSSAIPKQDIPQVKKAAEALGITKLFPTQKVESKTVERLTSEQLDAGLIGGYKAKGLLREVTGKLSDEVNSLVKEGLNKTPYQFGEAVSSQIQEAVAQKLKPATELYDKLSTNFKFIPVKKDELKTVVDSLRKEFPLSGTKGELGNIAADLGTIKNLDDLKAVRTSIGRRKSIVTSPETADLYDTVYQKLTDIRSNVLKDRFPDQKAAIEKADQIFAETSQDIQNLFGLKKIKGSVTGAAQRTLEDMPKEKVFQKIFKTEDFDQLKQLQQSFPNIYEEARKFKIGQIAEEATYKQRVTPRGLIKQIDKLNPEVVDLIFGTDGAAKAKNLKLYLDSLPENMNLSGTEMQRATTSLLNPVSQALSIGRAVLLNLIQDNAFATAGKQGLGTKALIGGGILGSQIIRKERK